MLLRCSSFQDVNEVVRWHVYLYTPFTDPLSVLVRALSSRLGSFWKQGVKTFDAVHTNHNKVIHISRPAQTRQLVSVKEERATTNERLGVATYQDCQLEQYLNKYQVSFCCAAVFSFNGSSPTCWFLEERFLFSSSVLGQRLSGACWMPWLAACTVT